MASTHYQKLQRLLRELFRTDQADLDFGIYRVINQKRDEINKFLDEDLLPQVEEAFAEYQSVDNQSLSAELKDAINQAEDLGFDPNESTKVKEIREQMASYGVDVAELENQVYAALYNFFRRYYDKGDFISQRRYKEGVYAIPYEGEEVKLHWANHDQYYIKTSEHLRNYTFKLQSGQLAHVKLVSADTEKDNRKEIDDKKRRFVLAEDPLSIEGGQLVIRFEYKEAEGRKKQEKLNEEAVEQIFALRDEVDDPLIKQALAELAIPSPTEADKKRTLLAKHLGDYTRRNTQDYFIHKDLGKFLRQELDFFIKNEIMHLDDIENETAPRVEQYLSKIKVIRKIAHKIISFLAQIEDFQKKLWLKKKFVVETNYCITLDCIPEDLYPEIAANAAQREEWVRLFAIDEIKGDLVTPPYSNPLTIEFLKANPYMVLDTKYFDDNFKYSLLTNIENLDEGLDGLLIHSENFQALNFIDQSYKKQIKSIYIDPPYNTKTSEILYKNAFKHSSWLSLIYSRVELSKELLTNAGIACFTIDDYEGDRYKLLLRSLFGEDNYLGTICIRNNPSGRSTPKGISITHEYAHFFSNTEITQIGRLQRTKEQIERYGEKDEIGRFEWVNFRKHGGTRQESPKMYYPIFISEKHKEFRIPNIQWNEAENQWRLFEEPKENEIILYPLDDNGLERRWKWSVETLKDERQHTKIDYDRSNDLTIYIKSRLPKGGILPNTWWGKKEYSATAYGTNILKDLFGRLQTFSYPKSVYAVEDCLRAIALEENDYVIDYFAGSGTTGHAVINLNRDDNGNRKYILIEMGEYFDTALKPRVQKAIYSEDWKDGQPISRTGSSHAFKYLKLESYEDTLNNLELARNEAQTSAMFSSGAFKEDYLLSYMLDVESQGSLLSLDDFETPFDYKLKIATDAVGETVATKIDLVETFNYLIGLHVEHISRIQGVVVVEGTTRQGEKTLVIWRNVHEMDNEKLDNFFEKLDIRTRDFEYDVIYVNGDNNLPNLRTPDERWKVRLIEDDFLRTMFDVEGI